MSDDDPIDVAAVRRWATDQRLIDERLATATRAVPPLRQAGRLMHVAGALVGSGRVSGASPRGNGDDSLVAVGVLAQIAADLLDAAATLLCGTNHYAGAALLRQVVEVEYLTWAFANETRDAALWLNSTQEERFKLFAPAKLRKSSGGQFLSDDYRHHCEQGGHPVPKAIPLLGNPDQATAQLLLLDLFLHTWRSTDNLIAWTGKRPDGAVLADALGEAQREFSMWGARDPLYDWSLTAPPAPPPT